MSDDDLAHLGHTTVYGKHLLQLGESQELLILNDLPCFPGSRFFTCRPYGKGANVVDYVLASQNLLPFIHHLSVSPSPLLIMHFFPSLSGLTLPFHGPPHPSPRGPPRTTFQFDEGDPNIFSSTLRKMLPSETQFSLLDSPSTKYTHLSSAIWEAALKSFPHSTRSTSTSRKVRSCPMNKWYNDKCKTLHRELQYAFTHSQPFYLDLKASYHRRLRRKK